MKKTTNFFLLALITFNIIFINPLANNKIKVDLSRCVDGDTAVFIIDGKKTTVRFLAVDTPESVHPTKESELFGISASEFTCAKLTNSTLLELEYDIGSSKKDKYNRDLAWVWVDEILLQKELIKEGYAKVRYIYGDYKYTDVLYSEEDIAKKNKVGIWGEENEKVNVTFKIDDNENILKVDKNDKLSYFKPIKKGYTFIGWKNKNNLFDFDTRISKDIVLEAEFEKNITLTDITISIILLFVLYLTNKKAFKKKLKKLF